MNKACLTALILFTIAACTPVRKSANKTAAAELIFQSGFEDDVKVVAQNADSDITGADKSLSPPNDWVKDLDNHPNIGNFNLQYQGGDSTMRVAKIIPEPGNPSNHVLQFRLNQPNVGGSKGRIQGNLYGNNGIKEFYQSVRVFLHDDFNTVKSYPKEIHWLTIAEFWNNITWNQTIPYRFRITLGVGKPDPGQSDLYFIVDAQDCELFADERQKYTTVWAETNKSTKVPIGKWFTMDIYFKEGNSHNGRFYLSITPENEPKKIIFDLKRITHNTQDPNPDGISDYNPFKLYTSRDLIDYMKSRQKSLEIYWDDFKLWKDKRPD
jgi:hypothetical protein